MKIEDLSGYYVYRSFINNPDPVEDFNKIKFAEAELWLQLNDNGAVVGQLSFPPEKAATEKGVMDITGTITCWNPIKVRFLGKGRAQTEIFDYEYEYDGLPALQWGEGARQVPALVGTVRRAKDHGNAKAGATASFVAVKQPFPEPKNFSELALIPDAIAMLASRVHRLRHTVWHTLREDWYVEGMTVEDRAYIRSLGWGLDDPPRTPSRSLDLTNGAGEDFLYMHRRMIMMLHAVYQKAGANPPASWKIIPGPHTPQFLYAEVDDQQHPGKKVSSFDPLGSGFYVPPAVEEFLQQFDVPDPIQSFESRAIFRFIKTDRFFSTLMRNLERRFMNRAFLASLSLGAFGNLLEMTIHNWMHMRWASVPRNPATGKFDFRKPYDIDRRWDDPRNDDLGNFHSSHVNPVFWRIHGWVDDRIEDWFAAHDAAAPGEVQRETVRGIPWFKPGKWVKKPSPFDWPAQDGHGGGHHHAEDDAREIAVLEEVMGRLKEVADRPAAAKLAAKPERRASGFANAILMDEALNL